MTFLMENLSTVIIGLILAGVVYLVVRKMIRDRREGKGCGCSGGCAGCSGRFHVPWRTKAWKGKAGLTPEMPLFRSCLIC